MRLLVVSAAIALVAGAGDARAAQERVYKNSIGMEFVRIDPGSFTLGRFQPPYAKPPDPNAPPPPGLGQTLAPGVVAAADQNRDQRVSREELVAAAGTWFDQMDTGKAGRLDQMEFNARFATIQTQLSAPATGAAPAQGRGFGGGGGGGGRGGGGRGGAAPVLFTASDVNRDGFVDRSEFTGRFGLWFDGWDSARTGALSTDQLAAGLSAALPQPAGGRGGPPLTAEQYRLIEAAARRDSSEGFTVTIGRPYYIGTYEVTQAQYRQVMGLNPSMFQGSKVTGSSDAHPVDSVTWEDAQAFVRRLNAMEKVDVYRLPTEFEWEYAARAGAPDDISWNDIRRQAWNARTGTQPVGKMEPNAWGLYDTLGNVWEWVQDYYNEKLFADPTPPQSGTVRVLKGGGFLADVKNLTYMWHGGGPGNKFDVGFRVVREIR